MYMTLHCSGNGLLTYHTLSATCSRSEQDVLRFHAISGTSVAPPLILFLPHLDRFPEELISIIDNIRILCIHWHVIMQYFALAMLAPTCRCTDKLMRQIARRAIYYMFG